MTVKTKDIFFSENCYYHPDWAFPEIEPEKLPIYNPILDAYFGSYWVDESFWEDANYEGEIKTGEEWEEIAAKFLHEKEHSTRFKSSINGLIRVCASLIYELIARIPARGVHDSEPLHVGPVDNWPLLKNLGKTLNIFHAASEQVEEIFNLVCDIRHLTQRYHESEDDYPFEKSPTEKQRERLDVYNEIYSDRFEELYRRWSTLCRLSPEEVLQTYQFYIFNIECWPTQLNLLTHFDQVSVKSSNPDTDYLGTIKVPRAETLENNYNILKADLEQSLLGRSKEKTDVAYDFPLDRLEEVFDIFRDSIMTPVEDIDSVEDVINPKKFSIGTARNAPDSHKGTFEEKILDLHRWNWKNEELFIQAFPPKSLLMETMRDFITVRYNVRHYIDDENPEIKDESKKSHYEIQQPSFSILPSGKILQSRVLNDWDHLSFKHLIFFEAMRQQIFGGKGLICPGESAGKYFSPPCTFGDNKGKLSDCRFRPFLKSIWENTEPGSDATEWTKPACL